VWHLVLARAGDLDGNGGGTTLRGPLWGEEAPVHGSRKQDVAEMIFYPHHLLPAA